MIHFTIKIAIIFTVSFLVSCTNVRQVEYAQSIEHNVATTPAPIKFTRLRTQLPVGAEIGIHRQRCFYRLARLDVIT